MVALFQQAMEEKQIEVAPPPLKEVDSGVFEHPDGRKLLYTPDTEFEMRMCCGQITSCDKGLMEFLAKTVVSFSVLGFCFLQLSNGEQSEFASSTISLILGTYLGGKMMANSPSKKT